MSSDEPFLSADAADGIKNLMKYSGRKHVENWEH